MGARRLTFVIGLGVFLAFAGFSLFADVYVDLQWFRNLGYLTVFQTALASRLLTGLAVALATALFILANLLVATRTRPVGFRVLQNVVEEVRLPSNITPFIMAIPAVLGILTGIGASGQWMVIRQFLAATPFGLQDPFFGTDIGFYVFSLPFVSLVYQLAFSILVITAMLVGLYYVLAGAVTWTGRVSMAQAARTHLFLLIAAMLALKAFGYRLAVYNLLYSPRGVAFGASYTDINAQLPALRVLSVIALVAVVLTLLNIRSRGFRWIGTGLAILLVSSVGLGSLYPSFIQQFQVSPDEISKETPYMIENIRHTNLAFGLDRIAERDYPAEVALTLKTLEGAQDTLNNVRLWDPRALKDTFSQLQEIRLYYQFNDVDVGRYNVDGEVRQVFLAAREVNQARIAEAARTWVNLHLKFTHGYGIVMSPASEVSTEGLPVFFIKDIPPRTTGGLVVTRPEVYYGELTGDYVVVNTREPEFDYPLGDSSALTHYEGQGGVRVGSFLNRLFLAVRVGSYRVLLTQAITPDSRVMLHREITDRTAKIAPFLRYDSDPYLVLGDDGRLFWIIDAYTTTDAFPYSEPYRGRFNYIRNSVKVLVDAYHGTVDFYVFDEEDPIVATYRKIFPDLFKPASEMREDLRAHVRYPLDLFLVQAEMLSTYHMRDPGLFYNKEDLWSMPTETYAGEQQPLLPYYVIMTIPGEEEPEFVLILPFTPAQKQNMVGWLAARSDGENYGELMLFRFPKDRLVFGPMQIEARIDQDAFISQQLTLWGQVGSSVIRGNLLVIPINSSLLYIEPLYLQSTGSRIPEFKRIIVAYGDQIVMENDLASALAVLFGEGGPGPTPPGDQDGEDLTLAQLIQRASRAFADAQEASQGGDWAGYGRALEDLRRALEALASLTGETPLITPDEEAVE
ncbi:MAG: UPF0182 family protein [Bacillota bacterium]